MLNRAAVIQLKDSFNEFKNSEMIRAAFAVQSYVFDVQMSNIIHFFLLLVQNEEKANAKSLPNVADDKLSCAGLQSRLWTS